MGKAAQHEAVHLNLAFGHATHRVQADPALRDNDHVQHVVHGDELDQRGRAELVKEFVQVELAFPRLVAAGQPAGAGLDCLLEPPPLALQGVPA